MSVHGILIDYEYCSGCQSCMMACQVEHNLPSGQQGVVVEEIGPWAIDAENDIYQFDCIPFFTDQCDLCKERTNKGKLPSCVKHCLAAVLVYGEVEELSKRLEQKGKQALFVPNSGVVV